ncbi:MAG TPA: hypothetical protein VJR89_23135, partial [Polyangiales bacterium]|nr:hypothetical protein [Polyangiales bacterium]
WPPVFASCAVSLAAWLSIGSWVGPSAQQAERLGRLQYVLDVGVGGYAWLTIEMALTLAWMVLPLGLACLASRRGRGLGWALAIALGGFALTWYGAWTPLAPDHATLTLYELGGARNLLAGNPAPAPYWRGIQHVVRALALASFAGLAVAVVQHAAARVRRPEAAFCGLLLALHVGLVSALWLYADRYYLAFLPALVACVLLAVRKSSLSLAVGAVAVAMQSAIGVIGTRDALQYSARCGASYAALVASGVPAYDIDAGWSLNGWMLYAQQQNLPAALNRERDVPAVTSKVLRPYLFAKAPVAGYDAVQHVRWRGGPWPWPNELYVLKQR